MPFYKVCNGPIQVSRDVVAVGTKQGLSPITTCIKESYLRDMVTKQTNLVHHHCEETALVAVVIKRLKISTAL